MYINKLELAKIISDFMFLREEDPEEKAKEVFIMKKSLTPHGFEKYIQYYFQNKKGYKVKLNGRTNQADGCVDLVGIKKEKGEVRYCLAQCKKYGIKDISESMIREFGGAVSLPKYIKYRDKTDFYYITTSKFTLKAQEFGTALGIKMVNFFDLYKLQKVYSLQSFKIDVKEKEGEKEINKCFEKEQLFLDLDDNIMNTIDAKDSEVYEFLKQIRRDISHTQQLKLGSIARNDTLEIFSRERPQNLEALKKITQNLSAREKNKINKYGYIFVERMKYLHKEKIEKNAFQKLLGF